MTCIPSIDCCDTLDVLYFWMHSKQYRSRKSRTCWFWSKCLLCALIQAGFFSYIMYIALCSLTFYSSKSMSISDVMTCIPSIDCYKTLDVLYFWMHSKQYRSRKSRTCWFWSKCLLCALIQAGFFSYIMYIALCSLDFL